MVSTEFLARVEQLPLVWSTEPGSFAHLGFTSRYPALVRDCVELNGVRFSVEQRQRLQLLHDGDRSVPRVESGGVGAGDAVETAADRSGSFSTGGGKFSEPPRPAEAVYEALSVGNKADGCYKEVKDSVSGADALLEFGDDLLLVDHSDRVISFLEKKAGESGDEKSVAVQYINDNSGTELLLDLALADHLLTHGWCDKVTLNVKMEPMYVSHAIGADVHEHIAEMQRESRTPEVQALGKRLAGYVSDELLVVRPDIFWNRYTFYWEMPTELYTRLEQEATLMIIKGDLNYRRLLGDRLWSPSTPIEEVVPYFPTAFVSLRTMKSTLVAGIPAHIVEKLEKEDSKWKFNGKRAIIQSVLEPQ
ncbi:hypothetical protein PF008_g22858 [Phytophthora fragariae]|uniref:Sugar phosphate phosphatase n=2 Tax=Phytophthora fragariae TaxID=53985 RepID=A0A6G0QSG4_9STRA|nr:hypothetical protein PF008_g22858 [Phytophthora fragariae]